MLNDAATQSLVKKSDLSHGLALVNNLITLEMMTQRTVQNGIIWGLCHKEPYYKSSLPIPGYQWKIQINLY